MAEVEVLRGGSGRWVARYNGRELATGHVPKRVRGDDAAPIVLRQLRRMAQSPNCPTATPAVGGGSSFWVEVEDKVVQALTWLNSWWESPASWNVNSFRQWGWELIGASVDTAWYRQDGETIRVVRREGEDTLYVFPACGSKQLRLRVPDSRWFRSLKVEVVQEEE